MIAGPGFRRPKRESIFGFEDVFLVPVTCKGTTQKKSKELGNDW